MTEQHPITPPPELRRLWAQQAQRIDPHDPVEWMQHVATQAARWGADQELEACCEWLDDDDDRAALRAAMRPKPPSLKERAQRILVENGTTLDGRMELDPDDIEIIRRALEQLDD